MQIVHKCVQQCILRNNINQQVQTTLIDKLFKFVTRKTTLFEKKNKSIVSRQEQFLIKTRRIIMTVLYKLIKLTIYN